MGSFCFPELCAPLKDVLCPFFVARLMHTVDLYIAWLGALEPDLIQGVLAIRMKLHLVICTG